MSDYIAIKDEAGRTQIAEVLHYDQSLKQKAWNIELHTGPQCYASTGQHLAWAIQNESLKYASGLDQDTAARQIAGWESARQVAAKEGHGFYDGIVLHDEDRASVRHIDRGLDVVQQSRAVEHEQGMEQSW